MKAKINLCLVLSVIIGFIMSAFTVQCYVKYVNPESDSLLVTASPVVTIFKILCTALVILALITPYIFVKKCDISGKTQNTTFVIFSSSLLGFLFCGYVLRSVYSLIISGTAKAMLHNTAATPFGGLMGGLYIAGVILAVPCAAYFIMIALKKNIGESPVLGFLATAPVLFFAARLIYFFMQTSAKVNAAGRKITIVSLCLCVIFFLYEANLSSLKKENNDKNKIAVKYSSRYLASGFAAVISLFISSVSTVLLRAFWLLEQGETYIFDAIFITAILYIIARINCVEPEEF